MIIINDKTVQAESLYDLLPKFGRGRFYKLCQDYSSYKAGDILYLPSMGDFIQNITRKEFMMANYPFMMVVPIDVELNIIGISKE